nr:hypothetical protein CFP56_58162 [Quercus suber]
MHNIQRHYLWEEWFDTPEKWTEIVELATEAPFHVPEGSLLISSTNPEQPMEWKPTKLARDRFSLLTWKILEKVTSELKTSNALGLRLASASFQPLLWSNSFWNARFKVEGERVSLFEKQVTQDATY